MENITLSTEKRIEKFAKVLDEVQAKSRVRTTTAKEVIETLAKIEKKIGITKKALTGTKVTLTGAEEFPNAYKYIPHSTHISAEYNGKNWIITDVKRDICPNRTTDINIILSDSAKEAVVAKYSGFCSAFI